MEGERCDFCQSGRLRARQVREYYRVGRGVIVIDDVPAYVCAQCGHRYFDAWVTRDMRSLSRRRSLLKDHVALPRVSFKVLRAPR